MRMHGRNLAVALALVAAACTGSGGAEPSPTAGAEPARGGTLRLAAPDGVFWAAEQLDPQASYESVAWELFRCCLLRTLVSYNGKPTDQGGAEVRPDLAQAMPEVSSDGLTWTFRLRQGLRYGPPLEDTEIVARDIVRALEREATPISEDGYPYFYSVIRGFDEYAAGEADSITGLETPDERTLVVRLHEPVTDLAHRFTLAATAPIPPGAAEGHEDDYSRFLVASGPYMYEGSGDLDPILLPEQQQPVAGYVPTTVEGDELVEAGSLTLVRNPSWDPATDDLRAALPDRIEIALGGDKDELSAAVEAGELDMVFGGPATAEQVRRYQDDPALADRVFIHPQDALFYAPMNVAEPPFDDVHVRRAVNSAIDKAALVELLAQPVFAPTGLSVGVVATHLAPDSMEGNLLSGFDPYPHDLDDARAEMRLSPYDVDGDGRCDAAACRSVLTLVNSLAARQARSIQADLSAIGIDLDLDVEPEERFFARLRDPSEHAGLGVGTGWFKDYPSASTWFPFLLEGAAIDPVEGSNLSFVGAQPQQLEDWGYSITSVPSVDERIDRCMTLLGSAQIECWAAFDQYVMTDVVPWVPYAMIAHAQIVSERVVGYSFDQFASQPALDRIQLPPASS